MNMWILSVDEIFISKSINKLQLSYLIIYIIVICSITNSFY